LRDALSGNEAQHLVRVLDAANGPSFSPSYGAGSEVLFFHTGGPSSRSSALSSVEMRSDLRSIRTIVDDGARNYHARPSPDGSLLAFDSDRDGERGVYLAQPDGNESRRVSGAGYAAVPTWSPDGTQLAFVRGEPGRPSVWNLWLLSIKGGSLRRLTHFGYGQTWAASWFPGGDRIAYTHEEKVYVHDLAVGSIQEFRSPIPGRLVRTPAVSPDGTRVIVQVALSGAWLLDLSDGQMSRVLADPSAEEFAWAPDGRTVAFHSRRDGQWGIWLMASPQVAEPCGANLPCDDTPPTLK
jgi:Tol biopolymer transport system component